MHIHELQRDRDSYGITRNDIVNRLRTAGIPSDYHRTRLISELLENNPHRVLRHMRKHGVLRKFTGELNANEELVFVDDGLYLVNPKILAPVLKEPRVSEHRTKRLNLNDTRRRQARRIMEVNFLQPRITLQEVDWVLADVTPRIDLEHDYRRHQRAKLTVAKTWPGVAKFSTDNFLVAKILTTETLTDNVTVHKALAWSKTKLRAGQSDLQEVWIAHVDTVHSVTTAKATALRGLTVKTKNRVVDAVWDL